MQLGLDYSARTIPGAAIRAAGYEFVIRYVDDPDQGLGAKHIRPDEYTDLVRAGVDVRLVFEVETTDRLGGFARGVAYAQRARAGAAWIGYPANGIIFFAADRHLTASEVGVGMDYLDGAASVLGPAVVGAYGFPEFIAAAVAGRHAVAFWQAGHAPDPAGPVHLWQRNNGTVSVGGVACDVDELRHPLPGGTAAAVRREDDTVSPIEITVRPDGTFRAAVMAEAGQSSLVVDAAWITWGSTWGASHFQVSALDSAGHVMANGMKHGDVANNRRDVMQLPSGVVLATIEGRVLDPGAVPAAALVCRPK